MSFGYEKGAFGLRRFSFADGRGTEAILRAGLKMLGTVECWVEMSDNKEAAQ